MSGRRSICRNAFFAGLQSRRLDAAPRACFPGDLRRNPSAEGTDAVTDLVASQRLNAKSDTAPRSGKLLTTSRLSFASLVLR
jgi:hypothetical protein